MGIFAAPTILSGQDASTFMTEVYETTEFIPRRDDS